MKSTYEKRWGHPRFRKATAHLAVKELKRKQAEECNQEFRELTWKEKLERLRYVPGFAEKSHGIIFDQKEFEERRK